MINKQKLIPPPICCLKNKVDQINKDQINNIRDTLQDCTSVLSEQTSWSTELFVLSRLIYKMNCQFRINKSLQLLKRVHICVKRYNETETLTYITEVKDLFESSETDSTGVFLPSRQMMECVLVQMANAAALMTRTASYCTHTYHFLKLNLELGIFIPQNMLFISVVSRIWALCRSTCLCYISWYDQIYKTLGHLEATKVSWLPDGFVLPVGLSDWLKKEYKDYEPLTLESSLPGIEQISGEQLVQVTDMNPKNAEENAIIYDPIEKVDIDNHDKTSEEEGMEEDFGSPVCRVDAVSSPTTSNTDNKSECQNDWTTDNITPESNVQNFSKKLNKCLSIKQLIKLVKIISKKNTDIENKSKVARCCVKLKKLKVKEVRLAKIGKVNRKLLEKGKKHVKNLFDVLDKGGEEVQVCDEKRSQHDEISSFVEESHQDSKSVDVTEFILSCSKAEITQMMKELKMQNFVTLGSKCYTPKEQSVANKLYLKLKKISEGLKENMKVLKTVNKLLNLCKQTDVASVSSFRQSQKKAKKDKKCASLNKADVKSGAVCNENKKQMLIVQPRERSIVNEKKIKKKKRKNKT